jgi:hypothetical protein
MVDKNFKMKIGFTGTQKGMTDSQIGELFNVLTSFGGGEFHHGDCVGADIQAALIAKEIGYYVVCHPPIKKQKRGYFTHNNKILAPVDYKKRNHDIVDSTDILIAAPQQNIEVLRSGTWSTIRYAKKKSKEILKLTV